MATHEVLNQPPPLEVNLFGVDAALQEAVERGGAAWAKAQLLELGQWAGSRAANDFAAQANENPPVLRTPFGTLEVNFTARHLVIHRARTTSSLWSRGFGTGRSGSRSTSGAASYGE